MKYNMLRPVAACLLSGATALAGSFSNGLSDPNNTTGFTLNGSGTLADGSSWMPAIENGHLALTPNVNSLGGTIALDDLDEGQAIESFTAKFKLQLGPGSGNAADGLSFVFGPDINSGSNFGETGPGMPNGGLVVSFDIYDNGLINEIPDFVGISVVLNGVEFGARPIAKSTFVSGQPEDVLIQLNRNGTLNLTWAGQTLYTNFSLPGYTPVNGQFAIGARTGGENANQWVSQLNITTKVAGAATDAAITAQPKSQTVDEHGSVTFAVVYDGTPPFTFQWYKNNTLIPDATNSVLTLANIPATDNAAKFKCDVANTTTVTSQPATLTVNADTTAPTLASIVGAKDFQHATLVFSEPLARASAENANNYKIANLTVTAAALSTNDNVTVVLTTSAQAPATTYTVTVNGVKDVSSAGNSVAADTQASFTSEALKVVAAGALTATGGAGFEVGVAFNLQPNQATALNTANYTLSAGAISGSTAYPSSPGVVLKATGLQVGGSYTLTIANVTDQAGNKMATVTLPLTVSKMKWGVVGGDRLGLGNGVVPVGDNGFDVYSDGTGEWGNYDEATLVYEEVSGDFDKKLRVEYQDSSSQWARAGLIARDVTNFGVDSAAQIGSQAEGNTGVAPFDGLAGRYQKLHVNPVTTAMGTGGNNLYEGNRRLETGGPSSSALTGANVAPPYPTAWCRLQRVGQLFTIYRSGDGKNWVQLGTTTFPQAMPEKLYVGPEYTPENTNITESDTVKQGMWLAKFRDYGDTFPVIPEVSAARAAGALKLTYTGTLQSAPAVSGPWTDVAGAASPYPAATTGGQTFFRAKK